MNSLQKVQKISKVLYVFTMIAFVCSIVGLVGSIIGSIFIGVNGLDASIINYFVSIGVPLDQNIVLCACICSTVECLFLIILYAFVKKFYKQELRLGNPFDKPVVKSMRKLGILHIVLPIIASLIIAIIVACFGVKDINIQNWSNITLGIVYLIVSFILEYGSELKRR